MGAVNDFTGETGRGRNLLNSQVEGFSEIARYYQKQGQGWVIVGDENYGEGSSREHAAMTPRYLGGKAVIVKSFARIHETNLKKQGILPLTFVNPSDYQIIQEESLLSLKGLEHLKPKSQHILEVKTPSTGEKKEILFTHSLNSDQIEWFKAGSSLNFANKKTKLKAGFFDWFLEIRKSFYYFQGWLMKTSIREDQGIFVIDVQGSLTISDADQLKTICSIKLKKKKVLFNLKDLSFVGSSGISIFYEALNSLKQTNSVKMCCVSSEFKRIFDNEGLSFSMYQSEEEALSSF